MVKTTNLILLASIVWGAAGFNILFIDINEYTPYWSVVNVLLSAAVYIVFLVTIFGPLVRKHTARIRGYTSNTEYFWKFFDLRSFVIMAVMISLGLLLRNTPAVPRVFIAVFYTGLGAALLTAGILFARNFVRAIRS